MDFNNLKSGHTCDCFTNAFEDIENYYAIKTMKDHLRTQDFNSYWDKGRRSENNNCDEICSLKGVSVSIFNDEVKGIYQQLFPLAPKYKPYLSVVRFYESAGKVKHTPNELNKHHYDFYKSDDFDYSKVESIEINELH